MSNRYKKTPVFAFPRDEGKKTRDALFWKGLQFPITVQESGPVHHLDVCPTDPHYIAVTGSTRVQIYNPETNDLHKTLAKFKEGAFGGRFRRDGKLLAAGTDEGQVKVFDLATKTQLRSFKGHGSSAVQAVDFLPDLKCVASFSDDRTVRLWDLAAEQEVARFAEHSDYIRAGCVSLSSPDIIISGSYDHSVKFWDRRRESGESVFSFDHGSPVEAVLLMPNDALLVSAGGHDIKIWDLLSGSRRPLKTFSPHNKTITTLGFANGSTRLVSGSLDTHVKFHDISTFQTVHSVKFPSPVLSAVVAPNDSFVAAGMSDGLVQFMHRKCLEEEREKKNQIDLSNLKPNQQYLKFTEFTPKAGDQIINPEKHGKEQKHDTFLRKFEHTKALDSVLKPYVQKKYPEYTYSVFKELQRRGKLKVALGGRSDKALTPVLSYLCKYISDVRFSGILIDVSSDLLDLYASSLGQNRAIDRQFIDLRKRVDREVRNQRQLLALQGTLDLILNASTASQKPELRCEEIAYRNSVLGKDSNGAGGGLKKHENLSWNKVLLY